MKTIAVAVAALAIKVAAHGTIEYADYFPECSLDCLGKAVEEAVDCSATDSICLCDHENYVAIYEHSMDCVIEACGEEVAVDEVLPAAEPYCSDANVLYSETATAPLPSHTHSHDEEEGENDHDHTHSHDTQTQGEEHTDAESAPVTTEAATTKAAGTTEAPTTPAETAAASSTESVEAVSTGAAGQLGSMGVAAMLAMGALAL